MKKIYTTVLIILITLVIFGGLYYVQYPIKVNKASLEMELQVFEDLKEIRVENFKRIDNKILALYTFNDGIGYAEFDRGLNGRCQLTSTQNVSEDGLLIGDLKTNKDKYKIIAGKNYDNRIKSIEFIATDQKNFVADISKDNYYILTISDPKGRFSFLNFDLYDDKGKSIRQEISSEHYSKNVRGNGRFKAELKLFNLLYVFVILISGRLIYLIYRPKQKDNITIQDQQ